MIGKFLAAGALAALMTTAAFAQAGSPAFPTPNPAPMNGGTATAPTVPPSDTDTTTPAPTHRYHHHHHHATQPADTTQTGTPQQ